MKLKIKLQFFLALLISFTVCWGQEHFPDVDGYETLICDFHMHTVFSDGLVWPTIRVDEAEREGIDAISLTDHIEYQPHKDDLPTNHNRPYYIAQERAQEKNVLLIKGTEITRDTPPGHYNAIYLNDIDLVADTCAKDEKNDEEKKAKLVKIVARANEQDAFVFWNHHEWKGKEKGAWMSFHDEMVQKKHLHGMEVANGKAYYPSAFQWCLENNLTMLGNSDIHTTSIDYIYTPEKHRTLTLVFAKEKTAEAVKEALQAGRTAVWYNNMVVGREKYIKPLFDKCVTVSQPHYINSKGKAFFEISNNALVDFNLIAVDGTKPATITIPAKSSVIVNTNMKNTDEVALEYEVENFLVAPEEMLKVEFKLNK